MAVHVALAAFLYAALTVARAPVVWGVGRKPEGSNPLGSFEPRISANLANQFEWPLFFHAACLLLLHLELQFSPTVLVLAWAFIIGRLLHSGVQIFIGNVRLRDMVFTVNFLAVLGLWCVLFHAAYSAATL
ncbi:MAPEG family protein [Luteimonas sp BLCC-B24]|uniref:MAPEG family protein n=1 Tax=Luteimonas sp. BLCC-B24 TaxID=3025317 RepID=UPI00234C4A50|nr:MAPEG family protein [Luteimonas sp. BLCC-B24]MDC7806319.1 MAPEG family protein [Luteimonas sp. BLCC-B24]